METIYEANEVKLSYKAKQKASERPQILDSKTSYNILLNCFDPDTIELRECFKILLLNRANKVLGVFNVSEGGISGTTVDIRLILQSAILSNASGIILSHNHPSGNVKPSREDNLLTERIKSCCKLMDINVYDHIIITSEGFYSYSDEGLL